MKIILVAAFLFLSFYESYCQNKSGSQMPTLKTNVISIGLPDVPLVNNRIISDITVLDSRFDSSTLGFFKNGTNSYSITTEKNTSLEISEYLNDYFQPSVNKITGASILMIIKKLWVTDELEEDSLKTAQRQIQNTVWKAGVISKFEFYYSTNEGYVPLYRFDTMFTETKSIQHNAKEYILSALIQSVKKLTTIDLKRASLRKKISLKDVMNFSQEQFNIPIIKTENYTRGIYKTFNEFKMNQPSLPDFEIKNDKLTDMVFVKDGENEYPLRDAWGYCDGKQLFIKSADNYFELVKKTNTFISIGVKALSKSRNIKVGNLLTLGLFAGGIGKGNKKVDYYQNLKFYELDMETGELF